MVKKFFEEDWEKLSKEELINARARLSGFIESTTEKEKTIRDVSIYWGSAVIIILAIITRLESDQDGQRPGEVLGL